MPQNDDFDNVDFPTKISLGAQGGPEFSTTITVTGGGLEKRNQDWRFPRVKFNITTGIQNSDDVLDVIGFFRARYGRLRSFRFRDWSDYEVDDAAFGIDATTYQIVKRYVDPVRTLTREITKPRASTVKVFVDGTETQNYTLDEVTGRITFSSAPNGVHVQCEYDIPARFESDELPVTNETDRLWIYENVNVIEVKEPPTINI